MRSVFVLSMLGLVVAGSFSLAAPVKPAAKPANTAPAVDFNTEVRPILVRHCFKCHGPDDKTRAAGLRLDVRDLALKGGVTGKKAFVSGKPDESELIRRVESHDARVMPPPATKNPLTDAQKQTLRRWVAAGAEYRPHWSFLPPKLAPLPKVRQSGWARNPIDYYVLARLERAGLKPNPEADKYSLVRRLYLDLIGLPPTPEEADAFVNDASADAYEKLIDRLLATPQYGERWARRWLDLARYADTNGYEKDRPRTIYPYRDWVINAINADMPFDQFTIEQLAGDMLPNATPSQRIATGFHRNTLLNEEGGIDPNEYRFYAMTDRIGTTGTVWLGLTIGCAQCHTHKFDPIPHKEYYQMLAFLDNADEPEMEVPKPEITDKRAEAQKQIAAREATLAERFPPESSLRWTVKEPGTAKAASGAVPATLSDGSVLLSGTNPERDTYTLTFEAEAADVTGLRVEAIPDPSLGSGGPGRTPHGNFVLSEVKVTVAPGDNPESAQPVKLARAQADFSQTQFPAQNAIDGNTATGWAIAGPTPLNVQRTLTIDFDTAVRLSGKVRWTVTLDQQHGMQHTLGRFRLSLGQQFSEDKRPEEVRRKEHLEKKLAAWQKDAQAKAVQWTLLKPSAAKSNLPLLTILPDGSVFSSGDQTKRDVYEVRYPTDLKGITAIQLEVLPDDRLPRKGPGRVFYEGPFGDFYLSELFLYNGDQKAKFSGAAQSFGSAATGLFDNEPQTGWTINGGQGKTHSAVLRLAEPMTPTGEVKLELVHERYFAAGIGRFRLWATTDPRPATADLPLDVNAALLVPEAQRSDDQRALILKHYLSVAPELASERQAIDQMRQQMPSYPLTLVMLERPKENPRPTFMYNRGEFLQPRDKVQPGVLTALPSLAETPKNRLEFAKWLVDRRNPLVGRVTMNRQWAAFFGRGIVRTTEDFGFQGDPATHPELLDFLAIALTSPKGESWAFNGKGAWTKAAATTPASFTGAGWSMKQMHKLLVMSATYRQSSKVTPQQLAKDPLNRLVGRSSRTRLEAELLRDTALKASALLSSKLGGPSVFPPQPPGVSTEGAYGGLVWNVSQGEDRYRRGLYTFAKRTAPYAMFQTFDAPSGEACVARRDVSNTPLQALTLMNDTVFLEAAQALGKLAIAKGGTSQDRATLVFRRCLTRTPTAEELGLLTTFYEAQKSRLEKKELDAAKLAGPGEGDPIERAAWTLVARSLLNLDEAIVKQ